MYCSRSKGAANWNAHIWREFHSNGFSSEQRESFVSRVKLWNGTRYIHITLLLLHPKRATGNGMMDLRRLNEHNCARHCVDEWKYRKQNLLYFDGLLIAFSRSSELLIFSVAALFRLTSGAAVFDLRKTQMSRTLAREFGHCTIFLLVSSKLNKNHSRNYRT